eukprot:TRINITY_DN11415_c0_g2_i5.p1 TRINITY_DN11415_c0_g2~~TRINITY_DN11415_c0_g2_i5.p1  ORF type:complete len:119 (+),score=1.63 TRINITY_DN11415_c0_g2_i5:393-749(+)
MMMRREPRYDDHIMVLNAVPKLSLAYLIENEFGIFALVISRGHQVCSAGHVSMRVNVFGPSHDMGLCGVGTPTQLDACRSPTELIIDMVPSRGYRNLKGSCIWPVGKTAARHDATWRR